MVSFYVQAVRAFRSVVGFVACFYVRVASRAYVRYLGDEVLLVGDLCVGRLGFLPVDSLDGRGDRRFVVAVGTKEGAKRVAALSPEILSRCIAVYAFGGEAAGVLAGLVVMATAMSGRGLINVWSRISIAPFTVGPFHIYAFWVCLWVLFFYVGYFFPVDDLLRHAVSYRWGYDYNIPYPYTVFRTHFDMYIGFDVAMGVLHRLLGRNALLVPQLFAISLTFVGLNRMLKDSDVGLRVLVLLSMLVVLSPRFMLGRPSVVCSSVMVMLIGYRDDIPAVVKVLIASLMGMLYHLCWMYFVPLVVFERKYLVSAAVAMAFWLAYSGGHYFGDMWNVLSEVGMRNVRIGESGSILGFFFIYWVFAIPFVLYVRRDWRAAVGIGFFSLTNQVRYEESLFPLLLGYFRFVKARVPAVVVLGVVFLSLSFLKVKPDTFDGEAFGRIIPHGSRVFSDEMRTAYNLVFWDSSLKVSPHYAYGLTPADGQRLFSELGKGAMDCGNPALREFDFVVERSLKGVSPACLEPVGFVADRRVWRVRAAR